MSTDDYPLIWDESFDGAARFNPTWLYFIALTVASNLILVNYLINIMGDALDQVQNRMHEIKTQYQIYLTSEYLFLCKGIEQPKYLFIVEPKQEVDE